MATVATAGDFQIGSSGSPTALVDLSAYVKSVKFSRNGETFDVTTFGNSAKLWVKGLTDSTMDVEFFYHATPWAQLQGLLTYVTGGVSFQYGPVGTTGGNPKVSATGSATAGLLLEKLDDATDVGQVKMLSASFKVVGAPTVGTY